MMSSIEFIFPSRTKKQNGGTEMKKKKILGLGGAVTLLFTTSIYAAPVLADQAEKQITAWFNTVTIKVNGKIVEADNMIYEGTTYVPLRAVSEMLGKEVTWDEASREIRINDPADSDAQSIVGVSDGNLAGNLANLGEVVGDENWTYVSFKKHVSRADPDDGLYRINGDGTQVQQISPKTPHYLNIYGEKLYYADQGVYKMDLDGKNEQKLSETGDSIMIADGWIYASDEANGIFKMTTDGAEQTQLVANGQLVGVTKDRLYYLKDQSIYSSDITGANEIKHFSLSAERHSTPFLQGSHIYYTDYQAVYRSSLDGAQQTLYTTDKDNLFSFNIKGSTLYVTEGEGNHGNQSLVMISLEDGSTKKVDAGGLKVFIAPNDVIVSGFSAGFHEWYRVENDRRIKLQIAE
jgi:hypothetical protein